MNDNPQTRFDNDERLINDKSQDESLRHQAHIRQLFWKARFVRQKKSDFIADSFIGLWFELIISQKNARKNSIAKKIESFFKQPLLLEATAEAGESAQNYLMYELTDSAKLYFITCTTDSLYGSSFLGLKKLKEEDISNKVALDTANLILYLMLIENSDHKNLMIKSLNNAWNQVFIKFPSLLHDIIDEMDVDAARYIRELT